MNPYYESYKEPTNQVSNNHYSGGGGSDDVVSIGTWILVIILLAIPIINFIVLLVLAFGDHSESLKNFAKATLILMVIGLLLGVFVRACSF